MRSKFLRLLVVLLCLAHSALAQRRTVTVTISPTSAAVAVGATRQFSATVTNSSDTSVDWQVNGNSGGSSSLGTISALGLYKAPPTLRSRTSVTVSAVSNADDTKSASAVVTLTAAPAVTVAISPTNATLQAKGTQKFTATVQNSSDTSVTWQVNGVIGGNSTNGTISTSGNYTAPSTVTTQKVVSVTAVSQADTSKSATAQVTLSVANPVSVSVSPTSASLMAGASQKFTATVLNSSNTAVTWQVNGVTGGSSSNGTISTSGNYTAPSSVTAQKVVTVTAVSQADTTKSATAQVTLAVANPVTVSVSPTSASLVAGATQKFTATVQNSSNTSVTWQVNGVTGGNSTIGTVSTSGNYRAPSSLAAQTLVTITAISQADTTKSASAQVTLTIPLPVSVSISPNAASLIGGGTQKFTATVQNSSDTSVTWQVNGVNGGNSTVGTISTSGSYKAPATIASQTVVTVTAISSADATKSASVLVSLNPVMVSISPLVSVLPGGGQQQFTATVQNASSSSVTWLVNGVSGGNSTVGTVSTSGLYLAPTAVTTQTVVSVTARSQADTTKSASAQLTLNPPIPPVSVTLNPLSAILVGGSTQLFSSTVQNSSDTAVTWYVNNLPGGSAEFGLIADAGSGTGRYIAPATVAVQTVVTVKAVSQADANKSASATVTVNPVSLTVSPASVTLGAGGTQTFAPVQNTGNSAVTWYLTDLAGGNPGTIGTISVDGVYLAPSFIAVPTVVTVKAVSLADSSLSSTAQVTLNPVAISILPNLVTLGGGATQAFNATVQYTANTLVDWSVNDPVGGGALVGTISEAGLYTAPLLVASQTVVSVKATARADITKWATVQFTLCPVSVSVLPSAPTVGVSKTKQFSATVQYSSNTGVTWQVNNVLGGDDTNGYITTAGLYTAPPAVPTPPAVTITAVSQADSAQFASTQLTVSATTGNSYYVSTTGDDTAAGTLNAPWKTISRAAAATSGVQAGDTVYVRGGVYKESVVIAVSGAALPGAISFESYPNENAIIDGTGLTPLSVGHGLVDIENQSYVTISGFEIRNYQTTSSSLIPAGIWISGSGSNIQILNNLVHDIKTSSEKTGQAYGIAAYGTGATAPLDTITIDGNQVYNLKTGGSESVNVDGNVSNFSITNNIIHDNDNIAIDAIGYEGVSPTAANDYARNGVISGNTIYNISGINNAGEGNSYDADGIYVDGGSQILIERNLIHNVDIGIEAAAEHKGKVSSYVTIRNNVIYNSNSIGITIGGYDSNRGGTDHCNIVNNTLYNNDTKNTGSGELQIQYFATNNVFKNNIVYAGPQGLLVNNYTSSSANPIDIDYNLYFSPLASTAAKYVWNGTARTGFPTFQTASGKDAHSQYLDPLFLNLATFDLHVQPTSQAVDLGIDLTPDVNGATDLSGNPRVHGANIDIGAYEQ